MVVIVEADGYPAVRAAAVEARDALQGVVVKTPLIGSRHLDDLVGRRVMLKVEGLQHSGSFKFRGAYNLVRAAVAAGRGDHGFVAGSSGNFALGLGMACARFGCGLDVAIPRSIPDFKLRLLEEIGVRCVFYDRPEDRETIVMGLAQASGGLVAASADDLHVVAGQATVALEMFSQARRGGSELEYLIAPTGGGGLLAGCVIARDIAGSETDVLGVEPLAFDDFERSLRLGRRVRNSVDGASICDGLKVVTPGALPFAVAQAGRVSCLKITDAQVLHALRFAFEHLKIVLEPSGAVGLAAAMSSALPGAGAIGVVLSGGNISLGHLSQLLGSGAVETRGLRHSICGADA